MKVDKMKQVPATFGLMMKQPNSDDPRVLDGLSLWICTSCGYSELFDDDAAQTLKNMEAAGE